MQLHYPSATDGSGCVSVLFTVATVMEGDDVDGWWIAHFRPCTYRYRGSVGDGDVVAAGDLWLIGNGGCPWAHRTIVARALLGLESAIPLLVTQTALGDLCVCVHACKHALLLHTYPPVPPYACQGSCTPAQR